MRRLLIALLLMAAACGQSQGQAGTSPVAGTATPSATATASPSPNSTPSASGPLLFAVLEAKVPASPYQWNTVAIAGLDGYARAKTTFIPMPVPDVGCMGAILPQSAHVAAGRVYFADGKGVVRSLSPTGQVNKVATFPMTSSQQMLSFAVSPKGDRLLGTVLTIPPKWITCTGAKPVGALTLDVYSSPSGGTSTLLYRQSLTDANRVMALTGWDAVGPSGTFPAAWASQGGGPASTLGVAVRIDAGTGKVLRQISDPNVCQVWEIAATGDFACLKPLTTNASGTYSDTVSVRRAAGSEIWAFTLTSDDPTVYDPQLAPDEAHVSVGINAATEVVARSGTRIKIGFYPGGWLDSSTLIGGLVDPLNPNPNMAYVRLSAPGTVISLGFPGRFVGTVQT